MSGDTETGRDPQALLDFLEAVATREERSRELSMYYSTRHPETGALMPRDKDYTREMAATSGWWQEIERRVAALRTLIALHGPHLPTPDAGASAAAWVAHQAAVTTLSVLAAVHSDRETYPTEWAPTAHAGRVYAAELTRTETLMDDPGRVQALAATVPIWDHI